MADTLREQIEGLPSIVRNFGGGPKALIDRTAVLDLLAERGATTREPDGWTDADWQRRLIERRETRIFPASGDPSDLRVYIGEAPQGAAGTAQTATASRKVDPANPDPAKWCSACGHLWSKHGGSQGCMHRVDSAWTHTNDRACGCSAKPSEPRPRSRRDECFYIGDASTPEEVLQNHMRGGDTLTPEPETAQIAAALRRGLRDNEEQVTVRVTRQLLVLAGDRLEAQAARNAELESIRQKAIDNLKEVNRRFVNLRRALVGEEAP